MYVARPRTLSRLWVLFTCVTELVICGWRDWATTEFSIVLLYVTELMSVLVISEVSVSSFPSWASFDFVPQVSLDSPVLCLVEDFRLSAPEAEEVCRQFVLKLLSSDYLCELDAYKNDWWRLGVL